MPDLVRWHKQYGKRGLNVAAIFRKDKAGLAGVRKLLRKHGAKFPVLFDPTASSFKNLRSRGYPAAFLLDNQGNVVWQGTPKWGLASLQAQVRRLLAKRASKPR